MNSEITIKQNIENTLKHFDNQPIRAAATTLLNTLGYYSKRVGNDDIDNERFDRLFESALDTANPSQKLRIEEWQSFYQIMQVADEEINQQIDPEQGSLFESTQIDDALRTSYMFVAVQLTKNTYTRTQLADITRFINKAFEKSIMVMFRYGAVLSLAIINRRPNLRSTTKQVLEKVTLIKDINLDSPKRAHIDIVSELHLHRLIENEDVTSFDTLHNAWEKVLNTEALNKQFYRNLFAWYEWAVKAATFPTDENRTLEPAEHVIRLITRLLFIWFLKEKNLVAEELFSKAHIQSLLKAADFDTDASYYRAVLQNLFFATLNTEMSQRGFSKSTQSGHRNFSRYRYKTEIRDTDKLLSLFAKTPFINGGLFDCLDSEDATRDGGYRIDCFSDVHYDKLHIANRLFFDETRGLFPLLQHYKFTVEENTPVEQEVALDPELLGRVFENLLAAYNPETGATVRKQTGSYYTPRAIVDYMVEEALVATLSQKCNPTDGDAKLWAERLHYLLDYAQAFDDANEWFDDAETDAIVRAISELKVLDPAVGSGAFPMGMLHKLTLALRRLDPDNSRWEQLQKERALQRAEIAFDTQDDTARREELVDIDETFKRYRDSDFGRKLYLIQNSIFGVDIQPVACQIAKLRFFISLAIEQAPEQAAENFGIKPLPNLETRFIAANTLIGLKAERTLTSKNTQNLERQLRDNRERHFHATTRSRKLACKRVDRDLRAALATELKHVGMPADDAEKLAHWDPYDPNATASWFDPEWMFGVTDGYDVMIGNPPYIKEYTFKTAFDGLRESPYYQGKMDIWYLFTCKGLDLVKNSGGLVTFIAQNNWVTSYGASKMRNKVIQDAQILSLIDFGSFKIFESGIQTMIMIFRKDAASESYSFDYRRLHGTDLDINDVLSLLNKEQNSRAEYLMPTLKRSEYKAGPLTFSDPQVELVLEKIVLKGNLYLNSNTEVAQGIVYPQDRINKASRKVLGNNFEVGNGIFVLSQKEKDQISFTQEELDLIKPAYTTQELGRYYGNSTNQEWVIYTDSGFKNENRIEAYPNIKAHLDQFREVITSDNKPYGLHRARNPYFFQGEKIISVRKCAKPTFTYVNFDSYVSATFYVIKTERTNQKYLTGLLNSKLIAFWLKHKGKMQGTNYQIDKQPLLALPLISPSPDVQAAIEIVVDQIFAAKAADSNANTAALEKEIDQLVYALYDLTPEEIAIVAAAE